MTARDGDPCDGYGGNSRDGVPLNPHRTGILTGCRACTDNDDLDQYFGAEGSACVGYRNDRSQSVAGTVNCDNLRFQCRRGDKHVCDDLTRHGAKWPSD
jgi:hypothetical protein